MFITVTHHHINVLAPPRISGFKETNEIDQMNQMNDINQINDMNQINQTNQMNQITRSPDNPKRKVSVFNNVPLERPFGSTSAPSSFADVTNVNKQV